MSENAESATEAEGFDDKYYAWLQSRYDFAKKEMESSVILEDLFPYLIAREEMLISNLPKSNNVPKRKRIISTLLKSEMSKDSREELDKAIEFLEVNLRRIKNEFRPDNIGIPFQIAVPVGTLEGIEYMDVLVPHELKGLNKLRVMLESKNK